MKCVCNVILIIALLIGNTSITVTASYDVAVAPNSSDEKLKSIVTMATQRMVETITDGSISECVIDSFRKDEAGFGSSGRYVMYIIDADVRCSI